MHASLGILTKLLPNKPLSAWFLSLCKYQSCDTAHIELHNFINNLHSGKEQEVGLLIRAVLFLPKSYCA